MQLLTRRLTDLWVVGRELTLDDGEGEPITVWIQKLNATEAADATRKCDAQRARVLATRDDHDGDAWLAVEASVREYVNGDPSKVVDFLLGDERTKANRSAEARIANDERWAKDNLIQGLRDAWNDTLERRWIEDNDDPEALACKEQLDRFVAEINEAVESEMEVLRDAWGHQSLGELETRMGLKLLDIDGNQAWMTELWACQIYFGTRDPVRKKVRYFESRAEVDLLSPQAYTELHQAYTDLEVDAAEGKGLRVPTDSSPSSVAENGEEMVLSSGPASAGR